MRILSENKTTALAAFVSILTLLFVSSASDFELHKHWFVLIMLSPLLFIGSFALIGMCRGWK
ncbi:MULTISPECIES: hypothetical protein [Pseudoalteromonas]|uniref:hypothetical protein n=1 Tax=Pseudoalteromonas TaxID=53246 RepID=UPI0015829242|nr:MULTISPECIES: hypothetical protein [Pseudoalteromonas]MDI4652654.1 hypothetical protein [Pseudoalteromonas shioyasakiensis]NUJ38636.1 hypothetical protein [Pseudoalteromonas sp. 0303]